MATKTTATTNFPAQLVSEMFNAVQGHSALAKLCASKPIPFAGETVFTFAMGGEVSIVGEGANKPAGDATVAPKTIRPVKMVYQHRVSDEFMNASEEGRLPILQAFADGFAKKMARGLDIAAMHGINPADLAPASFKATNSFDGVVSNTVTYAAATVDNNINAAVQAVIGGERAVNGIAMSPAAGSALSAIKVNGVAQYPEYRFGQNPDAFYGMGSDVNGTVSVTETGEKTDHVLVGDFQNAFRWGYAKNVPLEVIEFGDPDGQGDLKRTNEVVLRAEAYIGWGVLDAASFAIVREA
jgi:HK97 family phage major capsid protein